MGSAARDLMEQEDHREPDKRKERTRNGAEESPLLHRCRICARSLLQEEAPATSIFGEEAAHRGRRRSLQKLIHKYLYITVTSEDKLPKSVCTTCTGKLDGIHAFATMALRSQERLKQELLRTSVDSAVTVDSSDSSDSASNKPGDRSLLHSILTKGSVEAPSDDGETATLQPRQRTPSTEEMEVKVDPMLFLQCDLDQSSSDEHSDLSDDYSDREHSPYGSLVPEAIPLTNRTRDRMEDDQDQVHRKRLRIKEENEEDIEEGRFNETDDEFEEEDLSGDPDKPKSHICKICTRAFGTQIGLQNHLWSHLPTTTSGSIMRDQELNADGPDVQFQNNGANEHNVLGVSSFICPICGKKISTKGNLKVHLETHRPKGKYGCDICGRIFKTQSNLFRHKEYHSGVQFPCSVCGRVYPTNSTLRAHSITHSDLRPHACPLCDKTFKRNQDLKFHINQHTGARPYQCPYCPKAFASSGNCFSHRKRMHPKEVNRDRQRAADLMR